jgi:hypothetical protein
MTFNDAVEYVESYIYTMNGEYISEENIPSQAKNLVTKILKEVEK